MKIQVLLFGITTDLLATSSLELEVANSCSVLALKEQLLQEYPALQNIHSYAIAVNEVYASDELQLAPNDVVAIIPPVSGG